jgi:glycosyltransferase involved in cell wall biosynthesis
MPDGRPWPRISIVTPSYNQAHFIEETIRAILLQGYPDLEYIISEDCSTDDTMEIVNKYTPWLQVISAEQNGGMSKAINRAWAITTGEIVTWISSDDVYLPGAFQRVAMSYRHNPAAGEIVGAFHFMGSDSKFTSEAIPPRLPQGSPVDLTLQDPESWRLHQVSTFYLRHALEVVGFHVREDLKHNMDREILYRVCRAFPIALVHEPLACFRTHPNSKTWSVSNMVNMGEEYARVQDMFATSDPRDNAMRQRIASRFKAKGYLKYSKYTKDRVEGCKALVKALRLSPRILRSRSFPEALLNLTGCGPFVRRCLGRSTSNPSQTA